MKARILFSNPPWFANGERGELRAGIRAGSRWPFTVPTNSRPDAPAAREYLPMPVFMGFAASWCKRAFPDAEVALRDSLARRESYETYLNYIASWKPDYVIVETATPSWEHDKQVCKLINEAHPAARIIIVGTITTTRGKEITDLGYWAIKGEYEKGVIWAITQAQKARGGVLEEGYEVPEVVPHDLLTLEEMNSAPFPMYDEPYALSYYDSCPTGQEAPELTVWTSRGCPFKCCFCAWPSVMTNNDPDGSSPRKVRYYTPEYVEGWIRHRLAINPTINSLRLDDDTMNLGDKHTLGITAAMKRIGLPWSAMCRADTVKLETWAIMQDAGCFGVKIGMESGSQHVIDSIVNKKLDLADIESRILPHLKSIGLKVHTTWTVGLPGETPSQANETLRMIERLYSKGLHQTHQLSGTATIEGSPLDAIARGQKLKAYPGASTEGFMISGDGQNKIEVLASRQIQ
jgi:radical SAM superfamily enzyme YgiQ (UPF0313 family)